MKKRLLLFMAAMAMVALAVAQVPQKMTYQAVVRDSYGRLVCNGNVGVRISILQGTEAGVAVYSQSETVRTNANGLFTMMIGEAGIEAVDWAAGPYYLKSEVDPNGGTNYTLITTQQMMSVPYALRAHTVDSIIGGVNYTETDPVFAAWDKDYNDLINKPTIPTNVSEFTNDAGYITNFTETQVLSISNDTIYLTGGSYVKLPAGFSGDYNDLTNRPNLADSVSRIVNEYHLGDTIINYISQNGYVDSSYVINYNTQQGYVDTSYVTNYINNIGGLGSESDPVFTAWDKDYNDLTNKPTIPTVPTNVSEFTNDAGYITSFTEAQVLSIGHDTIYLTGGSYVKLPAGFSGDYNDLTNKPTIPTVPTNLSEFTNDAGYMTTYTETQVLSISNDTIYLTGGSYVKLPASTSFSGDYNDLTNKPTIPTVPTNISEFINDAGYLTSFTEAQVLSIGHDTIYLTGGSFVKLPAGFSGDYNDLANKPTIPTVPTNVSEFTNDAGYLTSFSEAQVLSISNDTIYLTGGSYVKLPAGFSGDYNDLTNKPTIPTVPTNVSEYTNDAGYLTSFTEAQVLSIGHDTIYLTGGSYVKLPAGFSGNYNDLTNKPTIPTVPTNVSEFTNDAGYITSYSETDPVFTAWNKDYNDLTNKPTIPTVPTNVSEFTNDAGYLTSFTEAQVLSIGHDTIYLTGGSYIKLPAGFSGDYNDLSNKPTIPTVPTNVSDFTNDAGYITTYTETQTLANVAALGNSVNAQIKNLSDPTENLDAVNKKTLDETISALMDIIEYQGRVIDTLKSSIGYAASVGGFDGNGSTNAVFSVSATKKVRFSKGNLQYQASTNTWRFAEHQYDYVGSTNSNISSSYTGWIDLFGFGTSGWNSGAVAYQPWSSNSSGDYINNNLVDDYANADWGVYNAISNGGNAAGMWRTLSLSEFDYLIFSRTGYRYAKATVGGICGLIIFPDNYVHPACAAAPTNVNNSSGSYTSNVYEISHWTVLENAGCIFLPAAGNRNGTSVSGVNSTVFYITSTTTSVVSMGVLSALTNTLSVGNFSNKTIGGSVRLVQDVE